MLAGLVVLVLLAVLMVVPPPIHPPNAPRMQPAYYYYYYCWCLDFDIAAAETRAKVYQKWSVANIFGWGL